MAQAITSKRQLIKKLVSVIETMKAEQVDLIKRMATYEKRLANVQELLLLINEDPDTELDDDDVDMDADVAFDGIKIEEESEEEAADSNSKRVDGVKFQIGDQVEMKAPLNKEYTGEAELFGTIVKFCEKRVRIKPEGKEKTTMRAYGNFRKA